MSVYFWRNVVAVVTGTAAAQAIPILGSLAIARLYAPAEFGLFSVWLGAVMLISVVLTARLESTLALEADGVERRLAVFSTLSTVIVTSCGACIVLAAAVAVGVFPPALGLEPMMLVMLIPAAASLAAGQTWQAWAAAEGEYGYLSRMRLALAATITITQIVAGYIHASASFLAVGQLFGSCFGLAVAIRLMPLGPLPDSLVRTIRHFWRRHYRFPLISLPADTINAAAAQLPLLIITARFGAEMVGYFALAMKIMGAPVGLLGKSVLDVFKRHASLSFRERGECRAEYMKTFKVLLVASALFSLVVVVFGESFFVLVFGEAWRVSGTFAILLLPLFALGFMASPLSYMVYIAGKQHLDLIWQLALFLLTVASFILPKSCETAIHLYGVGYGLLYALYLRMSYRFSTGVSHMNLRNEKVPP